MIAPMQSGRHKETEIFLATFNRSPLAIAVATPLEARFVAVNDTFCRWFGVAREDVVGKTYLEVGLAIEAVDTLMLADKVARRESGGNEVVAVSPNGERRAINLWMEFLEIDGQPLVATFIQDISAQKKLDQELQHAMRMEAVGRLAGGVAHDFNNLLTAVLGQSELLLRLLVLPGARERVHLESIHRAAMRAAALTNQLLSFSRKQTTHPTVLDVNDLVRSLSGMLQRVLPANINLIEMLSEGTQPVRADRNGLELALTNLIINARDAMPDGGTLRIQTERVVLRGADAQQMALAPGAYLRVEVQDTGVGMDDSTRARAFEPFFTTKPVGKGTGLGLSTVSSVVAQSGGHVALASQPRAGSTFTIHLPISPEPVEPQHRSPVASLPRGTETVMVVEDESEVRAFCDHVLSSCGYSVMVAGSPHEALAQPIDSVDLLVCDVVLPQMPGPALARHLTAARPSLKTLFISGYVGDEAAEIERMAGPSILQKPFSVGSLAHRVRSLLDAA
jgi:PAS domain S-box-containing protein